MQLYIWLTKATAVSGTNVHDIVRSFSSSSLSTLAMLRGGTLPTIVLSRKCIGSQMSLSCPHPLPTNPPKNKSHILMEGARNNGAMGGFYCFLGGEVDLVCFMKISIPPQKKIKSRPTFFKTKELACVSLQKLVSTRL